MRIVRKTGSKVLNHPKTLLVGGLVILFCLPSDGLRLVGCPFLDVTGYPCPLCGLTRSLSSLVHLDIQKSLTYHPLGIFVIFAFIMSLLPKPAAVPQGWAYRVIAASVFRIEYLVALFVIVWILRLFAAA